jgi:hypothetical protein
MGFGKVRLPLSVDRYLWTASCRECQEIGLLVVFV